MTCPVTTVDFLAGSLQRANGGNAGSNPAGVTSTPGTSRFRGFCFPCNSASHRLLGGLNQVPIGVGGLVHTYPMDESHVEDRTRLATAAAPLLKAGYKVESDVPGTLVVVASQLKLPVGLMVILSIVTVGFWIPVWVLLFCLPRVNRHTFTLVDGAVVDTKSWRTA